MAVNNANTNLEGVTKSIILSKKERLKLLKKQTITQFIKEYDTSLDFQLDKEHKVKLCSSDSFEDAAQALSDKYQDKESPVIMGHVSGFYEIATLAGLTAETCKKGTKPFVLFFDRGLNNVQNAIFNSLLIKISDNKEDFLTKLFALNKIDIVKAFTPKIYYQFLKKAVEEKLVDISSPADEIDKFIEKTYIDDTIIYDTLTEKFTFKKLEEYVTGIANYNADDHYDQLVREAKKHLNKEMLDLFKTTARNICDYLGTDNNYHDFIGYLAADLKRNSDGHILNRDDIFDGYKTLLSYNGSGNVKFLPGIDISTPEGLDKLSSVLSATNIISGQTNTNEFPVDIAVIPHIRKLQNTYSFMKKTVQDYVVADRDSKKEKSTWVFHPSVTLNIRDYNTIGAQFIKDERDNRVPLTNLAKIDPVKGFPLLSFIAGANYGNIYHSEVDTNNMVDMAIADGVDTVFIQGLFYATYYHNQTDRRLLIDPEYETLDSRLKAARSLIKKLNDKGVKVVYQMGDEEINLYHDMFTIYTREQGVKGSDFLKREDLRTEYDWVKPVIVQQLIPYLIRRGEDVTLFNTDDETQTRVSEVCHALKAYYEGSPLGDLAKYIEPKYLLDTDMFKVVFESVINYDKNDPALSVNLISNPNFSHITQYGNPDGGIKKRVRAFQMGAVSKYPLEEIPQLIVDPRQGYMGLEVMDGQTVMNVPQMINDEWYTEPGLLSGIKGQILADPTHKRVTQAQTKPNYPGGWTITGDVRELQRIIPYYKRVREVLEHVQKTGQALPELSVLHINDTQIGSPTERIKYFLKMLDVAFYEYNIRGIWGNGDFQQGWNYPKFANESRFLGSASVSQQMVDAVRLQQPWMNDAFGIVKPSIFEIEDPNQRVKIDSNMADKILRSLVNNNLILRQSTHFSDAVFAVDKNIDYKTVDLKLTGVLKQYEKHIREKLCHIHRLWFYHLVEGNHEYNTDWNNKGYNLIEHIKQQLDDLKKATASDLEVVLTEYFVNRNGDVVNAPYGSKTINGYNIAYGHMFRTPGKGSGGSATRAMANYFEQMGLMSNKFDRAFMGHLHIYSLSMINNMLLSVTGSSAGQSGYEQALGYHSQPMYVIDRYMSDGRIVIDTFGPKFLDSWEIKNPTVAAIGLDNFIDQCLTQEAPTFGPEEPKQVQEQHVRKLVPSGVNKVIGPNIK